MCEYVSCSTKRFFDLKNVARCHNFVCTKLNMTGGDIINILQDNEASVVSGITSVDSINTDRGLSVNDKKGKRMKSI